MHAEDLVKLKTKLSTKLPGPQIQLQMSPKGMDKYRSKPSPDHRKAAVLVLLYPKNKEWHVVYIKRTSNNQRDKHKGQISFPGGKVESFDKNLAHTALREAEEEIGIEASEIEILVQLSDLHVFVSNFMVYPFVGIINSLPNFKAQLSEVADIIEVPLSYLLDKSNKYQTDLEVRGITLKEVPYYKLGQEKLWGASAMITAEFLAHIEMNDCLEILSEV